MYFVTGTDVRIRIPSPSHALLNTTSISCSASSFGSLSNSFSSSLYLPHQSLPRLRVPAIGFVITLPSVTRTRLSGDVRQRYDHRIPYNTYTERDCFFEVFGKAQMDPLSISASNLPRNDNLLSIPVLDKFLCLYEPGSSNRCCDIAQLILRHTSKSEFLSSTLDEIISASSSKFGPLYTH